MLGGVVSHLGKRWGGGLPWCLVELSHLMLPGFGDYMKMGGEGKRGDFVIFTQASFFILSESTQFHFAHLANALNLIQ
jgi:hypothetical protein